MPEVSVIIPVYNRDRYISKAIDSVLAQTYQDFEIIVVDDGSTDNTRKVLQPYLDRIKYIYQHNSGVSSARNAGIQASTGNWIAFLDSDDRWHKEKLARQLTLILKNNIKVCFSDVIIERDTGNLDINYSLDDMEKRNIIFDDPFDLILDASTCPMLSTMIIEKLLLQTSGCFDKSMKVAEDTKLIYGLALQVKFGHINYPLTIFNRDENRNGLINNHKETTSMLKEYHLIILNDTYKKMPKGNKKNTRKIKSMLSHYLSLIAIDLCISGDYIKARAYASRVFELGGHYRAYIRSLLALLMPQFIKYFKNN